MIELTPGQAELLEKEIKWFHDYEAGTTSNYEHPQWFAYSGAAGCGKTTVAKELIKELNLEKTDYIGCAYTGKAVLQMQKNGLSAKTIHSLIYNIVYVKKRNKETLKEYTTIEFVLKDHLDEDYKLIIVDEAPMVNDDMVKELLSFGIPIVFMGDMNQLPPVFGTSSIMKNPDHILTQIMRQKENDPIVILSQLVLKGFPIFEGEYPGEYGVSKVIREYAFGEDMISDYDQILCTTNKLRANINDYIRYELLGRSGPEPVLFDKVICRQNNWGITTRGYPLTNGTQGIITDIHRDTLSKGYYRIDFHPDYFEDYIDFMNLHIDAKYIKASPEEQRLTPRLKNEKFEYAYAITVHLSQGSEYDRVLFFDSFFHSAELTKKARYTAITRAKKNITIVYSGQKIV